MADAVVLTFDKFWHWLEGHPNCILAAGTPEAVIYDQDAFHWHFGKEGDTTLLVQVLHGKELVGELLIPLGEITHVEGAAKSKDEFVFECLMEGGEGPVAAYHFTLSHGYDPEEPPPQGRWVH
jgi:hypothetical protein